MFCPKCKVGYEDGFFKCADCEESLVNKLPTVQETGEPEVHIEEVFRRLDTHEANLIKGVLESNNIKVFSSSNNFSGMNTFYAIPAGGIKIGVIESKLSEANEVLREYRSKQGEYPHNGKNFPFEEI